MFVYGTVMLFVCVYHGVIPMKRTELVPSMSKHQAQKGRSLRFLSSVPALSSTSQLQCSVRLFSFPALAHGSVAGEISVFSV